ncbi:MAG TPA: DUF302 domain-containing protein [Hellea balneolensis]|uniref:DUF302 domain-containing protein n=1 Tax=Hellea balneolensis TaxID=287478 RepID=A0A7C3CBD1_9PROT|nr:DUF302 domain-containing protein [Hellea balneolensis]
MSYHFSKTVDMSFADAIARTTEVLGANGFGVLSTIDIKAALKKKLDVNFRPYTILGACNPGFAYKALQAEPHIGTMLPCNVIVQDKGDEGVEVSAVDPMASMQAVENEGLGTIAGSVQDLLKKVISEI